MPDDFKTGDCDGSPPVYFFLVVQESSFSLEGVLLFATASVDIFFYSGLLLCEYSPPKRQIHLTPCFLIRA